MLHVAARRLGDRAVYVAGSFLRTPIPRADAVVASFALHHVRTRRAKAMLYARIHAALRTGGRFITVDCQPSSRSDVMRRQFEAWTAHLRESYSAARAAALLATWGHEDVYVPLDAETALLERAGFRVDVVWRKGAFAVLAAGKGRGF
jgi:hypothetical protein